jgi:hypothetical protein
MSASPVTNSRELSAGVRRRALLPAALLAVAMLATRTNHFGSALELPDASLAVFFFAGLVTGSLPLFGALLALAAGIDYVAITAGGVSDYCVTPAYLFLLPTYACLWVAGGRTRAQFEAQDREFSAALLGATSLRVLGAALLAFAISNLSFFAFSGKFGALTLGDYVNATIEYAVPYVGYALMYVAVGGVALLALRSRLARTATA